MDHVDPSCFGLGKPGGWWVFSNEDLMKRMKHGLKRGG